MTRRKYPVYIKLLVTAESIDDALEVANDAMEASGIREQDGISNAELVDDISYEYDAYMDEEDLFDEVDEEEY